MVHCSSCGAVSAGGKFCAECGAPLAAAATGGRRERRVVTILFADLEGFTSRSESLDVEDVEAFLEPYVNEIRRWVARTGGVVSTVAGDGIMAVFGAPVAHEDDPERGVRSALNIRDALDSGRDDPDALHVRIGVTTGEVLVTVMDDGSVRATGDVVNTAARLEAAAPAGGVLVDETTQRATNRSIVLEPMQPVDAKGKSEPVGAWLAVEPRSVIPEQSRIGGLPMIGREAEADILRALLDRSRREPSTQLVTVVGEPGIGKSRLIDELSDHVGDLPELITWRVGRSLSYGESVTFWALGEIVKSQAGILESDDAAVSSDKLRTAIEALIVDVADREWLIRHVRRLVGLEIGSVDHENSRAEAFGAWRRFFESIAESGPAVLVFEDVHWADDALLDFIDLLASRAGAIPLLIVCTARPELFQRREHWSGGKTNSTTISLTPLSPEDTTRLVGKLLDQVLLPAGVQQALIERAEGNPLYAQEYVRMLQDRGLLTRGDGGWELTGEVHDLPESIHGIIAARLDTLSPDEKALIQDAAVIGKVAWLGAVCELGGQSQWQADELLHGLEQKQLVRRARRSTISGETEFSFGHVLTRDVAYGQIPRTERAQKHEAAAAWIERVAGERDDKAELLADHYQQALTLQSQAGSDLSVIGPRACEAFAEAARQAETAYAHEAAARYYRSAIELATDDETRSELMLGEVTALSMTNDATEELLLAAIDAQVSVEAWERAASAERHYSRWLEDIESRGREADGRLVRAAEYAERVPPSETMFRIANAQAYRLAITSQYPRVIELTDLMIPRAEAAGSEVGRALLLQWRGDALVALDRPEGLGYMRVAADTLAAHAYPTVPAAYCNVADVLQGIGDLRGAREAVASGWEWARRLGDRYYIDHLLTEMSYQAYHAGDMAQVARNLGSRDHGIEMPASVEPFFLLSSGDVAGALKGAQAQLAYASAKRSDEGFFSASAAAARCHDAAGDRQADELCSRFLSRWNSTGGMYTRIMELCEIAPLLLAAGRAAELREAVLLAPSMCRWRDALLLAADGQPSTAAELYRVIGGMTLAAGMDLFAADQAAAAGNQSEALAHARSVREFAERAGAPWYAEQADRILAVA